jgi:hypothetical protein
MPTTAERFMRLFAGMEEAHGEYILPDNVTEEGKKKKGQARTIRKPPTDELWEVHLEGKQTLGIIPIRADNTCVWGAIDIDDYTLNLINFAKKVYKFNLPLIPCRSKSGGCHLILFLKEPVEAKQMQLKLAEIAGGLGFGQSEIFPKQSKVLVEKGDLGNWLNMPYFGRDATTRYALDEKGEAISTLDFLQLAEDSRLTIDQFDDLEVVKSDGEIKNGPPCLQALIDQGFPEGTRNNGLFALGIYCKKAFPDKWETELDKLNEKYMDPPLESKEVQTIVKQLSRKEYNYKCSDQPLVSFCNAMICRTRPFGIGGGAIPIMQGLSKIPTDQPVWFLDVNGTRLELSTEDIQIQTRFQKACMNAVNYMPPQIAAKQWQSIIQNLLDNCEILDKPVGAGIEDQFNELVSGFCADSRLRANGKEELLLGRPWLGVDPSDEETPRVFFRLKDLDEFLVRNSFRFYTRSQIISKLSGKDLAARSYFFRIKGTGVNVWHIDEPEEIDSPFDIPDMGGDVI